MQNAASEKLLATIPEAARRWSVSERMVWKAIAEGTVKIVKLGRATRIPISEVERVAREGLSTGSSK
ncbi:MAG: helix-turn-helix domain-containing protein [Phycisphaerales bacterium]|nr:helix-turn-helix domain-containing protein [Phycisphaerales bacterium]